MCAFVRISLLALAFIFTGCARSLPKYEKPIARAQFQKVRTTAYTHTEGDHLVHGRKTCLGTTLRSGPIHSAAADWSRWPAGTMFRIQQTGEIFEVDDIGWALAGRNTLDLYKPSRAAMNRWGLRFVDIEILRWGDDNRSRDLLAKRSKHRHVRRMLNDLEKRVAENAQTRDSILPTPSPAISSDDALAQSSGGLRPAL